MAQGSYYKGWASNLPNIQSSNPTSDSTEVYTGQVLSVDYNGVDAGKIRVRLIGVAKQLKDDDIKLEAYPADMCMVKYPLPGELVKVFGGFMNKTNKNKYVIAYYYTTVLSSNSSITYNGDPYMGQTIPIKKVSEIYTPEYKKRFQSRIKSFKSYFISDDSGDYLIDRGALKPSEGDIIIQGRFGSSIRLSSATIPDMIAALEGDSNQWSEMGGKAGDPVLVLTVNGTVSPMPVNESVDESQSSIYVSSGPTIPVTLATSFLSSSMFSYNLGSKGITSNDDDVTKFMNSKPIPPTMMLPSVVGGRITVGGPADAQFIQCVGLVIDNFEGGYWSNKWYSNPTLGKQKGWPFDGRYANSGETMYGIDRKTGGALNTSVAGQAFWSLIDQQDASNRWNWLHMGEPVRDQLKTLCGQIMQPHYNQLAGQYISAQALPIINSDPRLIIHFVYSAWNGNGWFKKFATDINNAVARGVTDPNQLAALAIKSRTTEGLTVGSAPVSLIKQGGEKMNFLFARLV